MTSSIIDNMKASEENNVRVQMTTKFFVLFQGYPIWSIIVY